MMMPDPNQRIHFYVMGLYGDGSNVFDVANGAWTNTNPFHRYELAENYEAGLRDGGSYGATFIAAARCECEETP